MTQRYHYRLRDPRSEIVSPENLELYEYWWLKHKDASCPRLLDFDLMDLYRISNRIIIRDSVDGGREFRTRYWGSALTDAYHKDTTGRLVGEDYEPEKAEDLIKFYALVLREPGVYRAIGRIRLVSGRDHISYETIYLPLRDKDGVFGHVISAWHFGYELDADEREKIKLWDRWEA